MAASGLNNLDMYVSQLGAVHCQPLFPLESKGDAVYYANWYDENHPEQLNAT